MTVRENPLPEPAFENAGLQLAQDANFSNVNRDSLADKLSREVQLLGSLPQGAQSGLLRRFENAGNWDTAMEVAGGAVVGVGLALAYRNPGAMWGIAGKISSAAPKALGTLAAVDLATRVVPSMADVWNESSSLERNKTILGDQIGALGFEYGTAILAGGAAAKMTSRVASSISERSSLSEVISGWKSATAVSAEAPVLLDSGTVTRAPRWITGLRARETVYTLQEKPGKAFATEAEKAMYDDMDKSVVKIQRISGTKNGVGTGFVVREDGLVATAYHVVKGHPSIQRLKVSTADGHIFDGKVVARDRLADIALIKLNSVKYPMQPLQIGVLNDAAPGNLYAFGHGLGSRRIMMSRGSYLETETRPIGLTRLVSNSLVDDIGKNAARLPLLPGMSGGPTISSDGKVIGVTTSIVDKAGISTAAEHLNLLLTNYSNALVPNGGVFSMRSKATFHGLEDGIMQLSVRGLSSRVLNRRTGS